MNDYEKFWKSQPGNSQPEQNRPPEKKDENFFVEILKFVAIAVIIVVPFRIYIAQPFVVDGASMDPTFQTGEYLIVDQLSYHFEQPQRGSVVIFKYPLDTTKYFIKRIIGLPGETVQIKNGEVTIYNKEHPEGILLNEPWITLKKTDENLAVKLIDSQYWVMGDNRIGSSDSRAWGPLPKNLIIGRPIASLFPVSRISTWPGDHTADITK
jgi:signal peptidase I